MSTRNSSAPAAAESDSRERIAGLEKGLAIIEAFGSSRPLLTLSEAARITGLSRASARRCLLTLEHLGYAEYDGKYFRLAPRVLRLGHAYLTSTPVPKAVQPVLETLSERSGESASVAILDGTDIVFIARSTTRRSLSVGVGVGTRLPAYCAATGRVMLAAGTDAAAREALRAMPLRKLTPKTLTGLGELLEAIRAARAQGYAIGDEEIELGLRVIAVPVVDSTGRTVAAMSLAAQTKRMTRGEMVERLLPVLESGRRMLASAL